MIQSLYDLKDDTAQQDRDSLYNEVLVLLGERPRWNEETQRHELNPRQDMTFLKYRIKGYTARDIASVITDAVLTARDQHMFCERSERIEADARAAEEEE